MYKGGAHCFMLVQVLCRLPALTVWQTADTYTHVHAHMHSFSLSVSVLHLLKYSFCAAVMPTVRGLL
jgi:hypothetical protein